MKQFLYLDSDIVNSIIAQAEKGLIIQQRNEKNTGKDNGTQDNVSIGVGMNGGASFLKMLSASADINATYAINDQRTEHFSKKEMIEKTLHDAAFDIALEHIHNVLKNPDESLSEGDYILLNHQFDCVDFDYLEGLFVKDGVVELIKKQEIDKIKSNAPIQSSSQQSKGAGYIKARAEDAVKDIEKKYKDISSILRALRGLIPYKRMLYSKDGFLIPLDDKYFRIDYSNLGFKYSGSMTCVGMVTNILEGEAASEDKSLFGTIQIAANSILKGILSSTMKNICVLHPIAVYYGQ